MFKKSWILAAALFTGLAACGDTLGEQALYGGAAGVGGAAVTGGNVGTGALIGAGANVAYCQTNPGKC
ncbi:hypothetical protein [Pseudooceanicola aestuarii]|uniref:hypothetical protein n=1 Tax=Pseudooceanicola aestuarii TaxID=2697319 RepID=UPI0013D644AB|nr:hypothetical protein [Pseudooceanicola aestuarii]